MHEAAEPSASDARMNVAVGGMQVEIQVDSMRLKRRVQSCSPIHVSIVSAMVRVNLRGRSAIGNWPARCSEFGRTTPARANCHPDAMGLMVVCPRYSWHQYAGGMPGGLQTTGAIGHSRVISDTRE